MANVTLLLMRTPLQAFQHLSFDKKTQKHIEQSGRWGELLAVKGPKVSAVKMRALTSTGADNSVNSSSVTATNAIIDLTTDGAVITETKRYTTMERFLQDKPLNSPVKLDPAQGFIELHPNILPNIKPYWVTFEANNGKVKELPSHDGRCFRVHGDLSTKEQAILLHAAPHVGWVVGCISPRTLGDTRVDFPDETKNPSSDAMEELYVFVGQRADFFVLDW